jgi:hypothetical protein
MQSDYQFIRFDMGGILSLLSVLRKGYNDDNPSPQSLLAFAIQAPRVFVQNRFFLRTTYDPIQRSQHDTYLNA